MVWCVKFECCVECGTTAKRHEARGLCTLCYHKQYRETHVEAVKAMKRKNYEKKYTIYRLAQAERRSRVHFSGNDLVALQRDGFRCTRCGSDKRIVVHHKDRSGRGAEQHNNDLSNLETLCRTCHVEEHRGELMQARHRKRVPQLNQDGRWSKKHDACVICNTIYSKHASKGRCMACYGQRYRMK